MADHSVGARDESHEGNTMLLKSLSSSSIWSTFTVPTSCYVSECHEKRQKSSTVCLVSLGKIVETKERSSRPPRNLSLFATFQVRLVAKPFRMDDAISALV